MTTRHLFLSPIAAFTLGVFLPAVLHGQRAGVIYGNAPVAVVAEGIPMPPATVSKVAERTLHNMEGRLGIRLESRDLTVQVCAGDRAYRNSGGLGNTDACYLAPSRILVRGYNGLQADLAHEFAHVLLGERTHDRCPVWMEEGIINHENHALPTGQYTRHEIEHLTGAIVALERSGKDWSLEDLGESSQRSRTMTDAFYGASWSATDYLYRTYGRSAVLNAVNLMSKTDTDDAFQRAFGRTPTQIEADWRATLR